MGDASDSALRYFIQGLQRQPKTKRVPTIVVCRMCGERNLRWGNKAGGAWELRSIDGIKHQCRR
jgi:hypothetical protein